MTAADLTLHSRRGGVFAELVRREPTLAWVGAVFTALTLPVLGLSLVDPRTLNDVNVWIKPAKFFFATGTYMLTLAWFYGYARPGYARTVGGWWVVWAAVIGNIVELAYITVQAGRGEASHFNFSSSTTVMLYNVMGLFAVILTSSTVVLAQEVSRAGGTLKPAYRASVVLGLRLAFLMTLVFAVTLSMNEGHWVGGVRTDAGGVPLLGWSSTGGDLRVPHFFGLHAMQAIPLAGALLSRVLSGRVAVAAVWLAAAGWTAFAVHTYVQALNARPFLPL